MKKLLTLLMLISMLVPKSICFAADGNVIRVEGENFKSTYNTAVTSIQSVPEFSGGACVYVNDTVLNREGYELEYVFNAPKKGTYALEFASLQLSMGWSTDFHIKINNSAEFAAAQGAVDIEGIKHSFMGGARKYSHKSVKLNKGENTMVIRIDSSDKRTDMTPNCLFTYIDYVQFTRVTSGFSLESLSCEAPANVFNNTDELIFEAEFSREAPEDKKYDYQVFDANEAVVQKGHFTVREGSDVQSIKLARLKEGWYQLKAFEHDTETQVGKALWFSVIDPIYATEFEKDFFAADTGWYFSESTESHAEQSEVASRCGISFMRERAHYAPDEEALKNSDKYRLGHTNAGIKVLGMYGNPDLLRNNGFDLMDAYNQGKLVGSYFKGRGDAFEIGNEPGGLGRTAPDIYASFLKACAIGITDGDPQHIKTNGGLAYTPGMLFNKVMFQNDIMSYIDVFSYHSHSGWGAGPVGGLEMNTKVYPNIDGAIAYEKDIPIWISESGISVVLGADGNPTLAAMRAKANHLVQSTVEGIATGNDKRFWFLWVHYDESGRAFGNFTKDNQPYISVSTMNIMANQLRDSVYRGPLANLPVGAEGHMIFNGQNDVAVVWNSDGQDGTVTFTGKNMTAIDYLGSTVPIIKEAENKYTLKISDAPVFVSFDGYASEDNYYKSYEREDELVIKTFDFPERIVIQQIWEGQDQLESKTKGYVVDKDEGQRITVNVYNFNDAAASGKLNIAPDDNFSVSEDELDFNIEPMSMQSFEVLLTLREENPMYGAGGDIEITGTLHDGEELSPSIAYALAEDVPRPAREYTLIDDFGNPENYDLANRGGGTLLCEGTDIPGEVKFSFSNTEITSMWCYPRITIEPGTLAGTAGLTYKIKLADDSFSELAKQKALNNVYVYMNNGESYFIQQEDFIPFSTYSSEEWTQVTLPWNSLAIWSGAAEVPFDPANIQAIGIGFNWYGNTTTVPTYVIKDVGTYISDNPADALSEATIFFTGIENNMHYSQNDNISFEAILPEGVNYERVKVILQNDYIYNEPITERKISVELGRLPRGYYRIELVAEAERNNMNTVSRYFYVD